MSDEAPAFVGTEILLYAFDDSDSIRQAVAQRLLLGLMETDRIRLSTQVLQEFYIALTQQVGNPLSSNVALAILEELAAWPVLVVDFAVIQESIRLAVSEKIAFDDALAVTAAARSGAPILYTERLADGRTILDVQIVNPLLETSPH